MGQAQKREGSSSLLFFVFRGSGYKGRKPLVAWGRGQEEKVPASLKESPEGQECQGALL